jgi:hypothetical protein
MRDAVKIFSCCNRNMELQMHKCVTAISLKTPGVEVLKHYYYYYYYYYKKLCVFVGLYCNN